MELYDFCYAHDTAGVCSEVDVDGCFVQAYISLQVLVRVYGASKASQARLAGCEAHRASGHRRPSAASNSEFAAASSAASAGGTAAAAAAR